MKKENELSEEVYHRIISWIERNDKGNGYVTVIGLRNFLRRLRK